MANEQNLIPQNLRAKSEQREIARKGGIARGKQRRDKRTFRETLQTLLEMPDKGKDGNVLISPITGKAMSIRESVIMQALQTARKGNVKALQALLDIMGERTFKLEGDINVKVDKYDNMTKEELQREAARLAQSLENP